MGGDTGRLRQEIERRLRVAGAAAVGFVEATEVESAMICTFDNWLAEGRHAGMAYMQNHGEIRRDPRLLLDGARTIISMAFNYTLPEGVGDGKPRISAYAFIPDYHYLLRDLIRGAGLEEFLGSEGEGWRICVDSAPIFERYWARKAGIGTIGENGLLSVPGIGSRVFLAEIVCRLALAENGVSDAEKISKGERSGECISCGLCVRECPTGALMPDATIDSNRCLSYLTIEHRGEWTDERHVAAVSTLEGRDTLFGCDRCLSACPLNVGSPVTVLPVNTTLTELTPGLILESPTRAKALIKSTPLTRATLKSLTRNALNSI